MAQSIEDARVTFEKTIDDLKKSDKEILAFTVASTFLILKSRHPDAYLDVTSTLLAAARLSNT